jgi:hypothetical protein
MQIKKASNITKGLVGNDPDFNRDGALGETRYSYLN